MYYPEDYGGVQPAVAAASAAGGGVVKCQAGKTYVLSGPLLMKSNVSVRGDRGTTLSFTCQNVGPITAKTAVLWDGLYTDYPSVDPAGGAFPTTAPTQINSAAQGATTITATVASAFAGWAVGQWISVREGVSPRWNDKISFHQIVANDGTNITLDRALPLAFDGSIDPYDGVWRITPVLDSYLEGIHVLTAGSTAYPFLTGMAARGGMYGCIIDGVWSGGAAGYGNDTYNFAVEDCRWLSGVFGGFSRSQYGHARGCEFLNIGSSTWESGEGEYKTRIQDNLFVGCTAANYLIGFGGWTWDIAIKGNEFDNPVFNNYAVRINSGSGHMVVGNIIRQNYGLNVTITGGFAGHDLLLADNIVTITPGAARACIVLDTTADGQVCNNILRGGNAGVSGGGTNMTLVNNHWLA
jgi:hypothetical protein